VTAHEAYPLTTCSPNSGDRARNGGHDVAGSHGPVHLRHPEQVLPVRSWSSVTRSAQMTPYVSCSRTPSETVLTAFGVTSLTFMMAMYALERRGSRLHPGVRTRMRTLVGVRVPLRGLAVRDRRGYLGGLRTPTNRPDT
jgi:hypothetical protein